MKLRCLINGHDFHPTVYEFLDHDGQRISTSVKEWTCPRCGHSFEDPDFEVPPIP
ncbi:hypothetical protein [Streptomyces sp.]|uniref:hypothetical protein n=1 Tax=Streptomyces sp. TaxID=1931 RepID=UPI002F942BC7